MAETANGRRRCACGSCRLVGRVREDGPCLTVKRAVSAAVLLVRRVNMGFRHVYMGGGKSTLSREAPRERSEPRTVS